MNAALGMRPPACRGFTLVEMVVALALLAWGTLGMVALLRSAAERARDADVRERLLWRVTEVADSLGTLRGAGTGQDSVAGGGVVRWSVVDGTGWVAAYHSRTDSAWVHLPLAAGPPDSRVDPSP